VSLPNERPCGGAVRQAHGRIQDEYWGIDRGSKLEKSKIWRNHATFEL